MQLKFLYNIYNFLAFYYQNNIPNGIVPLPACINIIGAITKFVKFDVNQECCGGLHVVHCTLSGLIKEDEQSQLVYPTLVYPDTSFI